MPTEPERVLILVEQECGQHTPLTLELLTVGRKLADSGGELLCACMLGHSITDLSGEIAYYADEVYVLDNALLENFQVDLYAAAQQGCRRKTGGH